MQAFYSSHPYALNMSKVSFPVRGKKLRSLREVTGLSQRELARQLGVHHSNLGYWEKSGNLPGSDVLPQLAKILGITVEDLLSEGGKARRAAAPSGRAGLAFEAVSKMPKRQQQKIVEVVEAFVAQQTNGHAKAA
jgi:transcriptional regulator with XRE-family HTH domain